MIGNLKNSTLLEINGRGTSLPQILVYRYHRITSTRSIPFDRPNQRILFRIPFLRKYIISILILCFYVNGKGLSKTSEQVAFQLIDTLTLLTSSSTVLIITIYKNRLLEEEAACSPLSSRRIFCSIAAIAARNINIIMHESSSLG